MDDILLASLVAGSKAPDDYVISKDAFSKPEPYGIMLRKDDPAFKKVVDAATAALYTGGEGQKIYDKWFTQKIPPKNLNLNVPISSELKNEFAKPSDSPDPDSVVSKRSRAHAMARSLHERALSVRTTWRTVGTREL